MVHGLKNGILCVCVSQERNQDTRHLRFRTPDDIKWAMHAISVLGYVLPFLSPYPLLNMPIFEMENT